MKTGDKLLTNNNNLWETKRMTLTERLPNQIQKSTKNIKKKNGKNKESDVQNSKAEQTNFPNEGVIQL